MQSLSFKIRSLLKYRDRFHHYVFVIALAALGACLPLSKFMISVFLFTLSGNWILEGNLKHKILQVYRRKSLLLLVSIMVLYLIGMLYTENSVEGLRRVRTLLPMLALPVILGTTIEPLSRKELKFILLVFVSAVCVSSIFSIGKFYGWFGTPIKDIRDISIFIYNGHFSLMVNFAIIILLYIIIYNYFKKTTAEIGVFIALTLWLIFFVFFLRSFMGVAIFFIVTPIFLIIRISKISSPGVRYGLFSIPFFLVLSAIILIIVSVVRYSQVYDEELKNLDLYTVNGNIYSHQPDIKEIENGHYVWIYICQKELCQEWNGISRFPYNGLDKKGQYINHTLIRYLTSKGLRKDSAGVHQLSEKDIDLIENGYANYIFSNKYGLYQRIYQIIWEIDMYYKTGKVRSHSVAQRIAFVKLASKIVRDHPCFGVGTGDTRASMLQQCRLDHLQVQDEWPGKPHNQYLNFIASFGLIGFFWIMFALMYPIYLEKKGRILLFNLFLVIYMISMFNIDTFDAHIGISFFAFFYSVFIYLWKPVKV
jgi:hypothetical protein